MKVKANGSTNGPGAPSRLRKLQAFHQERADALRIALDLLGEDLQERNTQRAHATIDQAVALDAARTTTTRKTKAPNGKLSMQQQRQRTADVLASFDTVTPSRPGPDGPRNIGVLLHHGYLKRKGDGFVRTKKPFSTQPLWLQRTEGNPE